MNDVLIIQKCEKSGFMVRVNRVRVRVTVRLKARVGCRYSPAAYGPIGRCQPLGRYFRPYNSRQSIISLFCFTHVLSITAVVINPDTTLGYKLLSGCELFCTH